MRDSGLFPWKLRAYRSVAITASSETLSLANHTTDLLVQSLALKSNHIARMNWFGWRLGSNLQKPNAKRPEELHIRF
jgi:hypothetical protein